MLPCEACILPLTAVQHLAQVFYRVPHVFKPDEERREAKAQDVGVTPTIARPEAKAAVLASLTATGKEAKLKGFGVQFNQVDGKPFRDMLQKSGYYAEWKKKFGTEAWTLLEKYTGKLA